jgi:hypothetical protein
MTRSIVAGRAAAGAPGGSGGSKLSPLHARARVALMLSILPILPKSAAPVALNYLGPISSQNVCGITWRDLSPAETRLLLACDACDAL